MAERPDNRTQAELIRDLRYGSPDEQEEVLRQLTAVGEAEVLDAVVEYLRSQAPELDSAGLEALRVLANKFMPLDRYGLAEALTPYLSSDDWSQRLDSVRLLGAHPSELAVDTLRQLVHEARDRVAEVRQQRFSRTRVVVERTLSEGIMALANCGRLIVLPEILELLDDPELRPTATRALGIVGSETERDRLEDLIEDDDVRVRDAAQWALSLMDERAEQFMRPPDEIPEPPPNRLQPIYWAHRQLVASEDDDLLQFLIVRIAIEHLMLDAFLYEGLMPETCLITVRHYEGDTPPDHRHNTAEVVGTWRYTWQGPTLEHVLTALPTTAKLRPNVPGQPRTARITINYPTDLYETLLGQVSFDCDFGPFMGRGWIYHVTWREDGWWFSLARRSWVS